MTGSASHAAGHRMVRGTSHTTQTQAKITWHFDNTRRRAVAARNAASRRHARRPIANGHIGTGGDFPRRVGLDQQLRRHDDGTRDELLAARSLRALEDSAGSVARFGGDGRAARRGRAAGRAARRRLSEAERKQLREEEESSHTHASHQFISRSIGGGGASLSQHTRARGCSSVAEDEFIAVRPTLSRRARGGGCCSTAEDAASATARACWWSSTSAAARGAAAAHACRAAHLEAAAARERRDARVDGAAQARLRLGGDRRAPNRGRRAAVVVRDAPRRGRQLAETTERERGRKKEKEREREGERK